MKKVGLALQGGGSHGAFTWGVLDRLLQLDNLEFDSICGTSAGAVNAIVMAYGLEIGGREKARELLDQLWLDISRNGIFKLSYNYVNFFTQIVSPYQFNPLNINPIKNILESIVDFDVIQNSNRKIFISATNAKTNQGKIFNTNEITVDSVLASTCLPNIFQAVKIGNDYYWDGGYMGNPPLSPLIKNSDINDLLLVKINSINIENLPTSARDISDRVTEICFNSSLMNEMKIIQLVNDLIKKGLDLGEYGNKEVFVHSISGYDSLGKLNYSTKLNTDYRFLKYLKLKGIRTADKWIREEFKNLGKQSTFDVDKHFFNKF